MRERLAEIRVQLQVAERSTVESVELWIQNAPAVN